MKLQAGHCAQLLPLHPIFFIIVSKNDSVLGFNFGVCPLHLLEDPRLGWFYSGMDWNEADC